MSVRQTEVNLTKLEDDILEKLGYREYTILIDTTELDPKPQVKPKDASKFSPSEISQFIDRIGGNGNAISYFEVMVSRLIPEALVRSFNYWYLIRDNLTSQCLPVKIETLDSRYKVVLAVIKVTQDE